MTPRELDRIKESIELLRNGMAGAEQRKPDYVTAYGYLTGAVDYVAKQLEKLLPVSHPTCEYVIGADDASGNDLVCGEKVVNGRCPEHGESIR